ncbi:MAG: hypothetical protein IT449_14825 [Phycisphaerales bacterium]|nr:hypothetical protein [Phycisphaerales bacterium]
MRIAKGLVPCLLGHLAVMSGCGSVNVTTCPDCPSAPPGTWTGQRVNPVSGESFDMSVEIDDGGQQFIGTVQSDAITFWRLAGQTVAPRQLDDEEIAVWEAVIGRAVTADLLLIEFSPTTKIEGHYLRGTFRARIEGDEMTGTQTDGEYEHVFTLHR